MLIVSPKQHKPAPKLSSTGNAAARLKRYCQDLMQVPGSSRPKNRCCKTGCSGALKRAQLCPFIWSPAWILIGPLPGPCGRPPSSSHQASLPKDSICLSPHLCVLCPRLEATLLQHALPHKVWRHHGHKTLRHHLLQSVIHQRHLQQSSCPFEEDKLAASHLGGCVKVNAVQGLAKLQVVPARCVCMSAQTGKG